VGTGSLTSWNGKTTGSLSVVAKAGQFYFELSNFATDYTGQNIFALADKPFGLTACGENNVWQVGLPDTDPDAGIRASMSFPLPNDAGEWDDPTFFTTFAFLQYPNGTPTRGCQQPIVALTPIHWTMKSIYPGLVVRDRGPGVGARGTVTQKAGGPYSYSTAQDDTWAAIARRFRLTPAELRYLNPIRHPDGVTAEAYDGQVLNLDPANRGDSESRRPGAQ
jgi:hypothetical protein